MYQAENVLVEISGMDRYHRWIISLFRPYLHSPVLEVGCGLGSLSRLLSPSLDLTVVDIDPKFVYQVSSQFSKAYVWDIQKDPPSRLKPGYYKTIYSANVLEHVANDQAALKNIYKLLKPGGHLLLLLPAKTVIYGNLDKYLGHIRRYEKAPLRKLLESVGFRVEVIQYRNFVGFFGWGLVSRFLGQSHPAKSRLLSEIYDYITAPFLRLEKYIPVPFGQNLFVVAVRS